MPIPKTEAHYCADRNGSGPGCNFLVFVQDGARAREVAYCATEDEVREWCKRANLIPRYLG